jgi:hypothetical protein
VLSIGQLELATQFLTENTRFGITLEAGITVGVQGGKIAIAIAEQPFIRVWTIETDAEEPVLNNDLLKSLLTSQLWPQLRGAFADGLSFDLPIPDISGLTSIAPALAGFQLSIAQVGTVTVRNGILVLEAELLGSLP